MKRFLLIGFLVLASAMVMAGCGTAYTAEFGIASDSARYGEGSLTVQFQDLTPAPILKYEWNFGDGGTSTSANPAHTYSTPGIYDVTLTAWTPSAKMVTTKERYVGVASPGCRVTSGGSIASAIASAPTNGIILIGAGDYSENLNITTAGLKIVGEENSDDSKPTITGEIDIAADNVTLAYVDVKAPSAATGGIIDINNAAGAVINQIELTGTADTCSSKLRGIAFYNSNGTVKNCTIKGVRLSADSDFGQDTGFAITVNGTNNDTSVTISNNTITGFQKQAITVDGGKAVIYNNVITGAGKTGAIKQNGIVLWDNTEASVSDNTISSVQYSGSGAAVAIAIMSDTVTNLAGDALNIDYVVDANTISSVTIEGYQLGSSGETYVPEQDSALVLAISRP